MAKVSNVGRVYRGRRAERLTWDELLELWDALFDTRELETRLSAGSGKASRIVSNPDASWIDRQGTKFEAETLDEVRAVYEGDQAREILFTGTLKAWREVHYWPTGPLPAVEAKVNGPAAEVAQVIGTFASAFPIPIRQVVFISWGGDAQDLAKALRTIVGDRVPTGVEVFFSTADINPGGNPSKVMIDENLQHADVTLAVLTPKSAVRPWLLWETAATWARGKWVIPLWAGLDPKDAPAPIQTLHQGRSLFDRQELDDALAETARRLAIEPLAPITEEEMADLEAAAPNQLEPWVDFS